MRTEISFKCLLVMANLTVTPALFAAGDMLTPDEVSHTGVSSKPTNDSGVYLGAGLTIGQGRTTDSGSTPGVAFLAKFEPGYQASTGSWSRLEVGAELFSGSVSYRLPEDQPLGGKADLSGLYGAMAKIGYGYSLGDDMFGIVKAGIGPVFATFGIEPSTASGKAKSDRLTGLAWTLGWDLVAPVTHKIDFTAGISWTQFQFDVSSVNLNNVNVHVGRTMLANIPAAEFGLRLRL